MANPAQDAAAGVLADAAADEAAALAQHVEDDAAVFGSPAPVYAEPFFPSDTNEAPTGEQPQVEEEAFELPEINWEVPAELQELLEEPDFDEDEDLEPVAEVPVQDEYEYDDPEKQQLVRQLAKANKKLEWERQQKIKAARKGWEAEANKYFQFSNPAIIQADSRRAFLKQAQAQHEAVAKVAKPIFDSLAEERKRIKEQALAEARAEAAERWGRPSTGPTAAMAPETNTQNTRRERLESSKGLASVIKQKFATGEVKI